jgi:hypothetical protein
MLDTKKIASEPIISHMPWAARASAGRACGFPEDCFAELRSVDGLGLGGLGRESKVDFLLVLGGWFGRWRARQAGLGKIGFFDRLAMHHCSNRPNGWNGWVFVRKRLGGDNLENVANLRDEGASMLAYQRGSESEYWPDFSIRFT